MSERVGPRLGSLSIVTGLIVFYVGTRLGLLWRFPPYFDESFYAHEAPIALKYPSARFISLQDSKGPLFLWLSFIPLKLGIAPLTAVRLVAQASGLWVMIVTGLLTRRLADSTTALVAMAILVVTPLWVVFSAIGFDEPLVAAAAMSALYLQLRVADAPTLRDGILLGVALGAGLLTKQSGEFAVVLIPISLLMFAWRAPDVARRLLRWAGTVVLALAIGYGLYSIERLSPLYAKRAEIAKSLGQYTPLGTAVHELGTIFQRNWPGYRVEIDAYLTVSLLVAFAIGLGVLMARRRSAALVLIVWILAQLVGVVLIANRPLGHYLVPVLSPALVLIAIGVTETARAARAKLSVPVVRSGAVVVVAIASLTPALAFDVRFVANPARTQLPAYDDRELITDDAAGSGWARFARTIKKRSHDLPSPHVIAYGGLITYDVSLLIGDPGGVVYPYVPLDSSLAPQAQFVVTTGKLPSRCGATPPPSGNLTYPSCSLVAASRLRLLDTYRRPRGGSTIALYRVESAG